MTEQTNGWKGQISGTFYTQGIKMIFAISEFLLSLSLFTDLSKSLCRFNNFKMLANFTAIQKFSFLLFTILELLFNLLKVLHKVFIFVEWIRDRK